MAEPATTRAHLDLPPKSYAEAVEEDPIDAQDPVIDESVIKETPPRPAHTRHGSGEPRPFGEVLDEALPSPGSPTLRHPKGRLESKASRESYASAVKEHSPAPNGLPNGDGHGSPVKQTVRNGPKTNGVSNGNGETFDGVGEDEAPRSPVKRTHNRRSSRTLNGDSSRPTSSDSQADMASQNHQPNGDALAPESPAIDLIRNKSGENLASVKRNKDDFLSLQQDEDKPKPVQRLRRDSELTSGRRAGEGWGKSAIRWAPLNVPVQRRLQTAMVLLHTLSIVGSLALFLLLCGIPLLWPILVPYLIYVLFSQVSIDGSLALRSEFWRRSKVWSLFASYFPARLHRSQQLEPTRKIPLYREYALRMGLASVSRESCDNILSKGGPNKEGMGRAITIVIGGARESLDAKPHTVRLVLQRRKGFVKLAIRCGADLVPTLAFGENDIYDQFDSDRHPWIHKAQLLVKKLMGFTIPLFHARGVFNYDVGLMPYRRPINIVVGRPIQTIQSKTPDPAYVDELHAKYVAELQRIWDEWKDTFARDREGELEIIE
ncbi:hypothetical protein BST61_g9884 [Cercospora zeina]